MVPIVGENNNDITIVGDSNSDDNNDNNNNNNNNYNNNGNKNVFDKNIDNENEVTPKQLSMPKWFKQ